MEGKREETESTEGQKLEWGIESEAEEPVCKDASYYEAEIYLERLNKGLKEQGKELWRMPTHDELVAKLKESGSNPLYFRNKFGYPSGTFDPDDNENILVVHQGGNVTSSQSKEIKFDYVFVRFNPYL